MKIQTEKVIDVSERRDTQCALYPRSNLHVLTVEEAKLLYIGAGGPSQHSELEWEDMRAEIQMIVNANNDRSAGKTIAWWGCWDSKHTATAFARRVRKAFAKLHP